MSRKTRRKPAESPPARGSIPLLLAGIVLLALLASGVAAGLWLGLGGTGGGGRPAVSPSDLPPAQTSGAPVATAVGGCEVPVGWAVYTVQQGDTLSALARTYGTEVDTLKRANCLNTDTILIGQELHVPAPAESDAPVDFAGQNVNIVLLGSDKRTGGTTWRTDTIIVVSVDAERSVVRILSIPRDLWVNIPGHGQDRINTADEWGEMSQAGSGPELVKQTLYDNLGLPIQYYIRVDFYGFMKIVDALGGLDVNVECPLSDIELGPGLHHLDGEDALLYARSRITTSDFDRSRRQRKLLMALWDKARSTDILSKIPALWVAMKDSFTSDLSLGEVLGLARLAVGLEPNRIFSQAIGPREVEDWTTADGAQVLRPIPGKIQALLASFYAPIDLTYLDKIGQTRVEVLNGSQREQAAHLAGASLDWAGFQVAAMGDADRSDYVQSQVIAYNGDQRLAEAVAQDLGLPPTAVVYQLDSSSPADIRVILGADYDPCAVQ